MTHPMSACQRRNYPDAFSLTANQQILQKPGGRVSGHSAAWCEAKISGTPGKGEPAKTMLYALNHWPAFTLLLDEA